MDFILRRIISATGSLLFRADRVHCGEALLPVLTSVYAPSRLTRDNAEVTGVHVHNTLTAYIKIVSCRPHIRNINRYMGLAESGARPQIDPACSWSENFDLLLTGLTRHDHQNSLHLLMFIACAAHINPKLQRQEILTVEKLLIGCDNVLQYIVQTY